MNNKLEKEFEKYLTKKFKGEYFILFENQRDAEDESKIKKENLKDYISIFKKNRLAITFMKDYHQLQSDIELKSYFSSFYNIGLNDSIIKVEFSNWNIICIYENSQLSLLLADPQQVHNNIDFDTLKNDFKEKNISFIGEHLMEKDWVKMTSSSDHLFFWCLYGSLSSQHSMKESMQAIAYLVHIFEIANLRLKLYKNLYKIISNYNSCLYCGIQLKSGLKFCSSDHKNAFTGPKGSGSSIIKLLDDSKRIYDEDELQKKIIKITKNVKDFILKVRANEGHPMIKKGYDPGLDPIIHKIVTNPEYVSEMMIRGDISTEGKLITTPFCIKEFLELNIKHKKKIGELTFMIQSHKILEIITKTSQMKETQQIYKKKQDVIVKDFITNNPQFKSLSIPKKKILIAAQHPEDDSFKDYLYSMWKK